MHVDPRQFYTVERESARALRLRASQDDAAGPQTFAEKRKPRWSHT